MHDASDGTRTPSSASLPGRALAGLLALLLAHGPLGCVAFPAYPAERDAELFEGLPRPGGVVRIDTSFDLIGNGRWAMAGDGSREKYLAPVASAYRLSGVFDRVGGRHEAPDVTAQVDVRGVVRGNRPLLVLSLLSLFVVPGFARSSIEVDTVLRDARSGVELGRARTCHALRAVVHLAMLPLVPTHAVQAIELDAVYGLARSGLALALSEGAEGDLPAPLAATACPASARLPRWHAARDARSNWVAHQQRLDRGPCMKRPSVKKYLDDVKARLSDAWHPPAWAGPVEIGFSLRPDGSFRTLDVTMGAERAATEAAVAAARRAAPFPPLTGPLECLADEELLAPFGGKAARRHPP